MVGVVFGDSVQWIYHMVYVNFIYTHGIDCLVYVHFIYTHIDREKVCMYVYIYIQINVYIHVFLCVHTYLTYSG